MRSPAVLGFFVCGATRLPKFAFRWSDARSHRLRSRKVEAAPVESFGDGEASHASLLQVPNSDGAPARTDATVVTGGPTKGQSLLIFSWTLLTFEAWKAVEVRLTQIACGRADLMAESQLMVTEKVKAAFEAGSILARGGEASQIVDHYRKLIAANVARLTVSDSPP